MASKYFEVVGPGFTNLWVPSRKFAGDSSLLVGQTATRLRVGEFLEIQDDGSVARGTSAGTGGLVPSFAYFSETGRGDLVTSGKVPVIFGPLFEADTMMVARTDDGLIDAENDGANAAFHAGDRLCVDMVYAPDDLVNKVYRGVRKMTDGEIADGLVACVGMVTRVFADKIRFVSVLR
jgi:hypothetical protein